MFWQSRTVARQVTHKFRWRTYIRTLKAATDPLEQILVRGGVCVRNLMKLSVASKVGRMMNSINWEGYGTKPLWDNEWGEVAEFANSWHKPRRASLKTGPQTNIWSQDLSTTKQHCPLANEIRPRKDWLLVCIAKLLPTSRRFKNGDNSYGNRTFTWQRLRSKPSASKSLRYWSANNFKLKFYP